MVFFTTQHNTTEHSSAAVNKDNLNMELREAVFLHSEERHPAYISLV
jgi:hypothetical protein